MRHDLVPLVGWLLMHGKRREERDSWSFPKLQCPWYPPAPGAHHVLNDMVGMLANFKDESEAHHNEKV